MSTLAEFIAVEPRFARSANLERDITRIAPLQGYTVTARVLDVVERVANTAAASTGGAWSITGPYGSGKSSLALLIDAAFGPPSDARALAWGLIDDASMAVGETVRQAHRQLESADQGFNRGLVTAAREPIAATVLRALHKAVLQRYGKVPTARAFPAATTLKAALADDASTDPRRTGPSPAALVEIARALAQRAPLLLVIDEFGKNLEVIGGGGAGDPYLLQQLVEAGQDPDSPMLVLTLQHMAFEDYLIGTEDHERREWAKVQGRFEDIAFVESSAQTRALIGSVFRVTDAALQSRIDQWAANLVSRVGDLGVPDLADPEVIAACYPLHPLTAAVLPELCNRYGQHERSLFSYLTGHHAATAASFLANTPCPDLDPLPSLGLDSLYDYFVTDRVPAGGAGTQSRWTEVATRIRDARGLSEREAQVAKAIAVLNLVATSGTVRASRSILELAYPDFGNTVARLEGAGLVTFRDFSDEYRIWHGTDTDVGQLLEGARERVRREPLANVLTVTGAPAPAVAARHSAQNDILRVFRQRYSEGNGEVAPPDPFSPHDGEVLLIVGSERSLPAIRGFEHAAKPIVAAIPQDSEALATAAREVAAIRTALTDGAVEADWVARRELGERLAEALAAFERAMAETFRSESCQWLLLTNDTPIELPGRRGSSPLSAAADIAYCATPLVRNEVLNRTELTSQGAKARRVLLEAMIERGDAVDLDLDGYGPEVAMYRAFIERTGLHSYDTRNDSMVFRSPTDESLKPAWDLLESEFRRAKTRRINLSDIYAVLLSPPIGMKTAVVPVFVTAGLLAFSDEVAIYEHGTFKPLFTADLSERMVRNPSHFDLKHYANATGARRQVIDALAAELDVRPRFRKHRVANVLAIVGHLVAEFRRLDNYTKRTNQLSERAKRARDVLAAAVEPDELLFNALPAVLGFTPVPTTTKSYRHARAYAKAVRSVLDELRSAYADLLDSLLNELLEACAEHSRLAVVGQAAALEDEVLNPEVRSFVLAMANDTVDSDRDWIGAVATVIAKKAPPEWDDSDRLRFRHELAHQIPAFQRLVALHAERRATGSGFDALRVAITRSDGTEHLSLISVDGSYREPARESLDAAIAQLAGHTRSPHRARQTLWALLSEELMPDLNRSESEPIHQRTRTARDG